jgi:hypothetical protein
MATPVIFPLQPLRSFEQLTPFLPDCDLHEIRPHLPMGTHSGATNPRAIGSDTAIIRISPGAMFAGTGTERFSINRIPPHFAPE